MPLMRVVVPIIALALAAADANCAPASGPSFPSPSSESVRVERRPVEGGAQLITLFVPAPGELAAVYPGGLPLLSYLKDTLGDSTPENDRVRQVWVLTAGQQSHFRRALNALPFVSFGPDQGSASAGLPTAAIDLANPARGTWGSIARVLVQAQLLDPTGMAVRTSSRAYDWNAQSRDDLLIYEATALLTRLDPVEMPADVLADVRSMHARLLLSRRMLGGLVRDRRLDRVYDSDETARDLNRAHNWELVRQQAEANGLYFEPISFGDERPTHAMIWVRRGDIAKAARPFDASLLKIGNPWGDVRLMEWRGYSETWTFDEQGSRAESGESDQVIPLALYSLDYPRVPLLITDFRSAGAAQRREAAARIGQNVTRGVLGFSPVANWNFFVAKWAWDFVARRHGAANDRPARLRTFAETSYLLSVDKSLRTPLRAELKKRLRASTPLMSRRANIAAAQYDKLTTPELNGGLPELLKEDRQTELTSYAHGPVGRMGLMLAKFFTFGAYQHTEAGAPLLATLDTNRRILYHKRVLETALERNDPLDAPWDTPAIRASVTVLMELASAERNKTSLVRLVERVMARAQDGEVRLACVRALDAFGPPNSSEIVASSQEPVCVGCRGSVATAAPIVVQPRAVIGLGAIH